MSGQILEHQQIVAAGAVTPEYIAIIFSDDDEVAKLIHASSEQDILVLLGEVNSAR